jgi:hypothetical protein
VPGGVLGLANKALKTEALRGEFGDAALAAAAFLASAAAEGLVVAAATAEAFLPRVADVAAGGGFF